MSDQGEPAAPVAAPRQGPAARGPGRRSGAEPTERADDFAGAIRRLLSRLRPERVTGLVVLVLAVGSVILTVLGPWLLGAGTDVIVEGMAGGDGVDFGRLHRLLLLVLGVYAGASVLAYAQAWMLAGLVQRTMRTLRHDIETKLHRLPLAYIDRESRGDILSRVTNDVDNVAQSMQQTVSQILTSTFTLIGVLVMMLLISPLLSLVALVTIPMAAITIKVITARSRPRFIQQWASTGTLNGQVEEAITGHTLINVFNQQEDFGEDFDGTNAGLYDASYRAQFLSGIIQPAMTFMSNLDFVVIAVVGGLRVASGAISIGDVQAFIQYSRQFTRPLTQMASMLNVLQSGAASAERVFALLDADEETPDDDLESLDGGVEGRVDFDHVDFSYVPGEKVISNFTYTASPGRTVAIVGPSGSGKTTLVNLVMRFYELDGGQIRIDGRDIATISRRDLRSKIGMVLQDTWLFEGTIRENIAYGRGEATEDEILEAARATYVDRFVRHLPDGYDTLIEPDAGNLSSGEKQLLTIARAFVADPDILILDEATSSVDTRTEVLVQDAMNALRSDRTSFVIAHRISTIRNADEILVIEAGQVVERGNHDELLRHDGPYARLYAAQFAAASVDDEPGRSEAQAVASCSNHSTASLTVS